MSIKNIYPILLLLLAIAGCSKNHPDITWSSYTCQDKSYTVEIPSNFSQYSNDIGGWMSFQKSSNNSSEAAFITIRPVTNGFSSFDEDLNISPKFQYKVYKESDSLKFAECNKGMWNAVQLAMLKTIDSVQYLIVLSSQDSRSDSEQVIHHIFDSMTEGTPILTAVDDEDNETGFAKYSNPYLTVSYPKDWIMVKNPDPMSDVYLGAGDESLGFSIVRFDTDASFDEIIGEAISGSYEGGMKITDNKNLTLKGRRCNRMVNEYEYYGIPVKTIMYTFKEGNTLYSIKFGTQKQYVDENIDLIEKIMDTFQIK